MKACLKMFLIVMAVFSSRLLVLNCNAQTLTPTPAVRETRLEIPWIKQESPNLCGLANLEMISKFYSEPLNDTQKEWLRTNARNGTGLKGSDLVTVLRAADYEAVVFPGTLSADENTGLYYHLNKGRPLVLMITSKDGHNSHYDIVLGYDLNQGQLFIIDPAVGPLTVSVKDFMAAWDRAHNFTLLAMPKKIVELQSTPSLNNPVRGAN
jgi:ABC-type bacteriocin/lantibiotic exporter with double-glycine peptidase domain